MKQERVGWIVYGILLLAAVFALGWFAGSNRTEPQIQVTVAENPVQHVLVPAGETVRNESSESNLIDLNTADQSELETLPGIGPELASRIIAYRTSIGSFVSIEQIMDVQGVGEKRFAEMEHLITVGGAP